ncbi:hypothetical protein G3T14_20875 [Methylobacterium sp. BTF04]|uniref:hypothetical protein n=1 Tax=Methylobacterium sp. BTF04 TaxID=2708300 RepID=UPI0013D7355D|nr:hypothetical protein [Methylobacterium sp. BTF04]NEU14553.1 hypothetical protein [Methylobacterium sp. BTF04]
MTLNQITLIVLSQVIVFGLGMKVGDRWCHARKRLAEIKKLMRRQNRHILSREVEGLSTDHTDLWLDVWMEVGPNEPS